MRISQVIIIDKIHKISSNLRKSSDKHHNSRGAILIEAAIGFPLFLLLIFVVIWIGMTASARITLHTAIIKATRVGVTRGINADFSNLNQISRIEAFRGGNCNAIDNLIRHNPPPSITNCSDAVAFYNHNTLKYFQSDQGLINLQSPRNTTSPLRQSMPSEFIYTLIYLNEWLRISLGSQVRYPCSADPTNPDSLPGCVECYFLHPTCFDCTPLSGSGIIDDSGNMVCSGMNGCIPELNNNIASSVAAQSYYIEDMPRGRVDIACRYRLPDSVLTPIFSLINFLTGGAANQALIVAARSIPDAIPVPVPKVP